MRESGNEGRGTNDLVKMEPYTMSSGWSSFFTKRWSSFQVTFHSPAWLVRRSTSWTSYYMPCKQPCIK